MNYLHKAAQRQLTMQSANTLELVHDALDSVKRSQSKWKQENIEVMYEMLESYDYVDYDYEERIVTAFSTQEQNKTGVVLCG